MPDLPTAKKVNPQPLSEVGWRMSHDIEVTDTAWRTVTLSFSAGGSGCWIFVDDTNDLPGGNRSDIRLDGDSGEAVKVAKAILDFYADRDA